MRQAASAALGLSLGLGEDEGASGGRRDFGIEGLGLGLLLAFLPGLGSCGSHKAYRAHKSASGSDLPRQSLQSERCWPSWRSVSSSKSSGSGRLGLGPSAAHSSSRDLAGPDEIPSTLSRLRRGEPVKARLRRRPLCLEADFDCDCSMAWTNPTIQQLQSLGIRRICAPMQLAVACHRQGLWLVSQPPGFARLAFPLSSKLNEKDQKVVRTQNSRHFGFGVSSAAAIQIRGRVALAFQV